MTNRTNQLLESLADGPWTWEYRFKEIVILDPRRMLVVRVAVKNDALPMKADDFFHMVREGLKVKPERRTPVKVKQTPRPKKAAKAPEPQKRA